MHANDTIDTRLPFCPYLAVWPPARCGRSRPRCCASVMSSANARLTLAHDPTQPIAPMTTLRLLRPPHLVALPYQSRPNRASMKSVSNRLAAIFIPKSSLAKLPRPPKTSFAYPRITCSDMTYWERTRTRQSLSPSTCPKYKVRP